MVSVGKAPKAGVEAIIVQIPAEIPSSSPALYSHAPSGEDSTLMFTVAPDLAEAAIETVSPISKSLSPAGVITGVLNET
jgi:hypothetical protein